MTATAVRRPLLRALVVDDDDVLAVALARMLEGRGVPARPCVTYAEGNAALADGPWDLAVVDVRLPDGSGVELCRALCAITPRPIIVAISGVAAAEEGYALARLGVHAFLAKPFEPEELWRVIEACAGPPLEVAAANVVGTLTLTEAQAQVRRAMLKEALGRGKTIAEAARILGVSRQAVQQALDDLGGEGS